MEPNATFRVAADGETGDCKGLTLSQLKPRPVRSRGFSLNRGRGGHEHSLHLLPRRRAAAEAAEAAAPEATEAATAAPSRVTRTPSRAFQARSPLPIYCRSLLPRPAPCPGGLTARSPPTKTEKLPPGGACRPVRGRTANDHHGVEIAGRRPARPRQRVPDANRVN